MRTYQHAAAAGIIPAVLCLLLLWQTGATQSTLSAGDIAFTGYNSDNPDDFSFVLLKNVTAGTTISFTDQGWTSAGGFRPGEGLMTITFSSDRVVGEQFRVPAISGIFLDFDGIGAGTSSGANILLSASGDQIFAFQGSEPVDNSPAQQAKFIAALQMNGQWQADALNDQTSALPPGLTNGVHALAIAPQVDNARYNCSVSGATVAALRMALYQQANWTTNDNIRFDLPAPCNFLCGLGTDNRPPLVFCPFSLEEYVNEACDYTLKDFRSSVFVTDNCGVDQPLVQNPAPGTVLSGNTMITMSTGDAVGNVGTCSFQLFVTDTIPPKFANCLNDQTLNAGNSCQLAVPDYTGSITAVDNCDPAPVVSQNPAPGTLINQSSDITITLMDASGNTSKCLFRLNVRDVAPPTVACASDRFAFFSSSCSFVVPDYRNLIKYSDNCDGNPVVVQSPTPGTMVHQDTRINFTITDAAGNQSACAFWVYLQDITPPAIQCPASFTIPQNQSCQTVMPDLRTQIVLNDACDPAPSLLQIPAAGQAITSLPFISFLTSDASGNFNFCAVPAIFRDDTPPTLVCKPTIVMLGAGGTYSLLASEVIASMSDNCGAVSVQSIVPSVLGCQHSGLTVPVVVTVRDADGNTASCTAQVTVSDASSSPSGWTSSMVGNTAGSAVARSCDNSFILYSSGYNFGTADAVQFLHRTLCGNGEIIARVQSVDNIGAAGVMMRETLAPGSKKAALKTRLSSFIFREMRFTANGNATSQQFPTPTVPRWLRVVRNGSFFTGYHSMDGVNWSFNFNTSVPMNQCIYVGIYAESINLNTTTTAVFDNVSVVGSTSPLWANDDYVQPAAPYGADWELFPNPAENEVFVRLSAGMLKEVEVFVRLLDVAGRPVWTGAFKPEETDTWRIPLQNLQAGIYVLCANTASGQRHQARLVVQPSR